LSSAAAAAGAGERRFGASLGERVLLSLCAAFLAALSIGLAVFAAFAAPISLVMALAIAPVVAIVGALALRVIAETVSAYRLAVVVRPDMVALRLPSWRGHATAPATEREIGLSAIDAIETRAEAFSQLGTTMIQQAYRLRLMDGETILLGADRQMKAPLFGPAAAEIASRANLGVTDLGMVDGRAGALTVFGASVPDWTTATLSNEDIAARRAGASRTLTIMGAASALVLLARLIARR
jgi:hypothetical protein